MKMTLAKLSFSMVVVTFLSSYFAEAQDFSAAKQYYKTTYKSLCMHFFKNERLDVCIANVDYFLNTFPTLETSDKYEGGLLVYVASMTITYSSWAESFPWYVRRLKFYRKAIENNPSVTLKKFLACSISWDGGGLFSEYLCFEEGLENLATGKPYADADIERTFLSQIRSHSLRQ